MAEGLDLYDDVLTTGAEMPVGPEDEVLQAQVRTQSDTDVTCRNNLLFLNWSNSNNLRKTKNGRTLFFGFFVTFLMMVPAERPKITPCPCFPESFESVVRSFSAGEISLPPPLSDIPGNMYQTCNTLFDTKSRH